MKCSVPLAILLEITANLYVHRHEIRHSKRGQARRQRRQATERPNRLRRQHGEKTGSVGCVWPQRASSAGRKECRGGSGATVSVGRVIQGSGRSTPFQLHCIY
jgi:hypothetical protein